MSQSIFYRLSFLSLFLLVVLLPIFFLPFAGVSIEAGKGLLLVSGLLVSVIAWVILRFSDGKVSFPRSFALLAGLVVVVVTLVSALFSSSVNSSIFGSILDIGSFWFIFAAFFLMFLSSIVFNNPRHARVVLGGTIISSVVVLVFQIFHIFLPKISSFGFLTQKTDNLIGSWNSLGLFAGFTIVSVLFAMEFFPTVKRVKMALVVFAALALFVLVLVNYSLIWELLGVFSLLIFIYKISNNATSTQDENTKRDFPIFSLVVVLVSLFFFMTSSLVGSILPVKLGVVTNEVSPSFMSTMSITKAVITDHPLLGIGPNRFGDAWAMYKSSIINNTQFWDVAFNFGSGLLPTFTATTGVLGILAWLVFLVLFIISGVRWLFLSIKNNVSLETVSFFFLSLYLFVASFFYVTSSTLILLAFVFAGIFLGLVASTRERGEVTFSFFEDHRKTFFFMLFLVVLMLASAALGFKYVQRFISVPYFTKTLSASSIPDAELSISRALSLNNNDLYLRTFSQVYLLKLNSIVSSDKTSLSEEDKTNLQASFDRAILGAQSAVSYNNQNYLNYQMLGTVFQTAGVIGVKDAYANAFDAYKKASELNPANPRLKLVLSDVSFALKNSSDAKDYAKQALSLKADYVDALVLLAQIAKSEGKNQEALSYAEQALRIVPGNKDLAKFTESLKGGSANTTTPTENNTN